MELTLPPPPPPWSPLPLSPAPAPPPDWFLIDAVCIYWGCGHKSLIALGGLINLLGSLVTAAGLLLMKLSDKLESDRKPCCRWRWLLGVFLNTGVADAIVGFLDSFLPMSLTAPYAACTVVFTILLPAIPTPVALFAENGREPLCPMEIAGIAAIVGGLLFTSIVPGFVAIDKTFIPLNADAVEERLGEPTFLVPTLAMVPLVAFSFMHSYEPWTRPCIFLHDKAKLAYTGLARTLPHIGALVSAVSASTVGAICALGFKSAFGISYWVATRENSRDIGAWGTWVMVAFVLVGGPMQYLVLQRTILKEELWYAVPLYQSLLIAFSVFAGGTFNHEWVNA